MKRATKQNYTRSEDYKRNMEGGTMSKEEHIEIIVEELGRLNNEYYFKIIYCLIQLYREEEA